MAKERGFEIEERGNSRAAGKNYLLIIGIDKYQEVDPLHNAVKDSKAVRDILLKRYSFEASELIELYDEEASRENIIEAFDELSEKITSHDNLLIYYAGHGYYRQNLKLGYWVPVKARDRKFAGFIEHSTIRNYIRAIPSHHTFLIVDSCFSGNLLRGQGRDISETVVHASKVDRFPSRWCLAAGMIEKVSDGFIGDHSPFARSLITFLEKNQEARFPVQDLVTHVSKAASNNADQTPIGGIIEKSGDQNGQFVFDLKKDEARDWQKLIQSPSTSTYRSFVKAWPEGRHTEEVYFKLALEENSLPAYRDYLNRYEHTNGKYVDDVIDRMEQLERETALQRAIRSGEASLRRFIRDERRRDRESIFLLKAQEALDTLLPEQREPQAWQTAEQQNTEASYQRYLYEFPNGSNSLTAKNKIEDFHKTVEEERKAQEAAAKRKADRIKKQEEENEKCFQKASELTKEPKKEGKPKEDQRNIKKVPNTPSEHKSEAKKLDELIEEEPARTILPFFLIHKQVLGIGIVIIIILLLLWSPWKTSDYRKKTLSIKEPTTPKIESVNQNIPLSKEEILRNIGDNMVIIPGGSFKMGNEFENGKSDAKPIHTVKLDSFYLSTFEVTFEEYDLYVNETGGQKPNDEGWGRAKRPAIYISWLDAIMYCNWLSQQKGYKPVYKINSKSVLANWSADGFRLPTEAEWEFAARGGKGFKYSGSNNPDQVCWNKQNSKGRTHPVGQKEPNGFGLFDMSGNVREWCWDWYAIYYLKKPNFNPKGFNGGYFRVLRGGSWAQNVQDCQIALRNNYLPPAQVSDLGFRLARTYLPL
ncbi:MAG: SUMF1/EgtB/PvdO family nonheme iron enzyme [Bacteroidota bacterium]